MEELDKYLVSLLEADTILKTLLGATTSDSRIYPEVPDQLEKFPCIVYQDVDSRQNSVPVNTQTNVYQLTILTKASKSALEAIATRIKTLLNYESNASPRVFWIVKINELSNNSNDRQLYSKVIRLNIWTKI